MTRPCSCHPEDRAPRFQDAGYLLDLAWGVACIFCAIVLLKLATSVEDLGLLNRVVNVPRLRCVFAGHITPPSLSRTMAQKMQATPQARSSR